MWPWSPLLHAQQEAGQFSELGYQDLQCFTSTSLITWAEEIKQPTSCCRSILKVHFTKRECWCNSCRPYILCWCVSFDAVYPELPVIDLKEGIRSSGTYWWQLGWPGSGGLGNVWSPPCSDTPLRQHPSPPPQSVWREGRWIGRRHGLEGCCWPSVERPQSSALGRHSC